MNAALTLRASRCAILVVSTHKLMGREVRLVSPEHARPHVKARKNDDRDAEAIAEAATRPAMRFVTLKSEGQLDLRTLHRVRDRLVGDRTSPANRIRSLPPERGHVAARGHARLRMRPAEPLDADEAAVSPRMAFLLADMRARRAEPDRRIAALDAALAAMAKADPRARRLAAVPGIGALDATALVAPGGGCR